MQLVDDWAKIIAKAWSVKFSILAALMGGAEVAVQLVKPAAIPDGLFAAIAALISVAATVARVLQQQELSGAKNGTDTDSA